MFEGQEWEPPDVPEANRHSEYGGDEGPFVSPSLAGVVLDVILGLDWNGLIAIISFNDDWFGS